MAANQAEVDLVVSAAGALPDLERQLTQIVNRAEDGAPTIDVQASLAAQNSIAVLSTQLDRALRTVDRTNPTIDVSAALDIQESLRNISSDAEQLTRLGQSGLFDPIELQAELDFAGSLAELTADLRNLTEDAERTAEIIRIEAELDEERVERLRNRFNKLIGDLRTGAAQGTKQLGRLGGGLVAAGTAGAGLANTLAAVAAAAQQIAPAAAVGTSALLTMKLATGTLKLALVGVEDAIKGVFDESLTADEFHESIKGLAPEARLFVDQLHTMRRELRAVQQEVQNRVFRDLDGVLVTLARKTGPQVTRALNTTADSLNKMAKNTAVAAGQLADQGVLGQALKGATTSLQTLEQVPARAARSFGFLAAASAPALNRIAIAVDDVSLKISQKLQRAFESGALEDAIDEAVATLAQGGRALGNIFSGIGNIFSGLTQGGRGLFDILEDLSEAFDKLTASKEFQTILGELAKTADTLVATALPLIQEAFVQLGPVIEELAPVVRDFVAAIGPELIPLIQQLGPILVDIALILKEQLPLAIELASAAIGVLSFALDIVGKGMELAKGASEVFSDFLNSDFANAMGSASDAAVENSDEIQSAFIHWTAEAGRLVSGFQDTLSDFSSNVRETLVGGFVAAFNETLGNVQDFVGKFIGAIAGLPDRAYGIGLDIMNGLAGGLTAGITRVLGIANDIANRVTSTIKGALDIRSPSKVMIQVGKDVDKGLELGMLAGADGVARVAKSVADKVRFAFPERTVAPIDRVNLPRFTGQGSGVVNVYIGNQLVKQIVNEQFRSALNRRDRTYAQGVRI
ncbi:phage tail protein [Streptomyces wedmorensis]